MIDKIFNKIKKIFIKTDAFREHVEDELSIVLKFMSNYKDLDDVKRALLVAGMTAGLNACTAGIGGTVASTLTPEQINTIAKLVIEYGHKAELLASNQLAKH